MTPQQDQSATSSFGSNDEISLLDLMVVLAKHKWLILGLPLLVAVVAAYISMNLPFSYTATARLLPPQQRAPSAVSLLSQLSGGLGGLAGIAGGFVQNPNEIYIGMLRSRTIADNLIARFKLDEAYGTKYSSDTRKVLGGRSSIVAGKEGIITIEVEDNDPKRAADLANSYAEELEKLTNMFALTESSQRRLFFERQLATARDNLSSAQVAARDALERGGIAQVDAQGRALLEVTANLRAQISLKEVQMGAMRSFAAEQNPALRMAQQELDALKRELERIEGSTRSSDIGSSADGSTKKPLGTSGLNNLARMRNVRYFEMLYELLARQYEAAKMDEARDSATVQVLDKAVVPDRRSGPQRTRFVLIAGFGGLLFAVLLSFILEAFNRTRKDPKQAPRLAEFRRYLRLRPPADRNI